MILLSNIRKTFENSVALDNIQCEMRAGKTTVLIRPSGCGKSTLIRLIVGLIPSDTGEIYIEDMLLNPENILHIRHKIGYVIQEGGLFPHLTARRNITLLAKHLKWDKSRIHQRIDILTLNTNIVILIKDTDERH